MINILVADDHQMVREGIISLLSENTEINVWGEADNGREVLFKLDQQGDSVPDIILMDINMPHLDGIACTREVRKTYGDRIRVLALSMVKQGTHIKKMLHAGAYGYILKDCDKYELFNAIKKVYGGETYYSDEVAKELLDELSRVNRRTSATEYVKLTEREKEVLQLILADATNKEIASQLNISVRTVETHKQNLLQKTGANSVAGLVVYALNNNLASDD